MINHLGVERQMLKHDTVRLLRECDAGIDMAIFAIDATVESVQNRSLRRELTVCRQQHIKQKAEIEELLHSAHDDSKSIPSIAKALAWIKIKWRMVINPSDHTVAEMIIRGCNMGIESLSKYLDQYPAAADEAKRLTTELIERELQTSDELRCFL